MLHLSTCWHTRLIMYLSRTIQSLGVFNGAMLLGMKQDDIRAICPEEGGRVFFQLQSVRSTVAVSHAALFVQSKLPTLYKFGYLWSSFHCGEVISQYSVLLHTWWGHLMSKAELTNVISLYFLCSLPVRLNTARMVAADDLRTPVHFDSKNLNVSGPEWTRTVQ